MGTAICFRNGATDGLACHGSNGQENVLKQTLFLLRDIDNHPCAMAGFGRNTDNYRVINMVFVPKNFRGMGIGGELIKRMTLYPESLDLKTVCYLANGKELEIFMI